MKQYSNSSATAVRGSLPAFTDDSHNLDFALSSPHAVLLPHQNPLHTGHNTNQPSPCSVAVGANHCHAPVLPCSHAPRGKKQPLHPPKPCCLPPRAPNAKTPTPSSSGLPRRLHTTLAIIFTLVFLFGTCEGKYVSFETTSYNTPSPSLITPLSSLQPLRRCGWRGNREDWETRSLPTMPPRSLLKYAQI